MKKISKKTLVGILFVSVIAVFVLGNNIIFASEFEGNEEQWTATCSSVVQDEQTRAKCQQYKEYLNNLKVEKQNQAAEAQEKIDGMQGDIDALAQLSFKYSQDVASINAEVDTINGIIAESETTLANLEAQILEKEADVEARIEVVLERMLDIQVTINTNEYINMLMGSEDLLTFIRNTQGIATFTELDKDTLEELNEIISVLEFDKEEQIRIKDMQEVQRNILVQKQTEAQNIAAANDAVHKEMVQQSANLASIRDISQEEADAAAAVVASMPTVQGPPPGGGSTSNGTANANFYSGWYDASRNIFSPTYTGQCTWYVYGRANEVNGGAYVGRIPTGNAAQWLYQAQNNGLATGSTPRGNSIMVWGNGYYGHVAYVESYDEATGTIRASEGNVSAPGGGLPIYTDLETAIRYTMDATWSYSEYVAVRGYPLGFIYL